MGSHLTIGRWITDRAQLTPERVAIVFGGERTTYLQIEESASALAAELAERGLNKGDRVSVLSTNRPEYVHVLFACALGGYIMAPLNWRLTTHELAFQLEDSDPGLLIVEPGFDEQASEAVALSGRDIETRSIDTAAGRGRYRGDVSDEDPLLLMYTSGTTGHPKGALLTHANCFWTNVAIDRLMDVTTFDVVLQVLPQFHIGGWNVQPLLAFWKGAKVILEREFDAERALSLVEEHEVTTMMGVPANYLFMAESPKFDTTDLSSIRMAVVGGAPMPKSLLETWHARGVDLVQGYGLTEAAPNVLGLPPESMAQKVGYAGKPYPHVDVALRALHDETLVIGPGSGELLVRGPSVFAGYWRNPEETRSALRNGWLHTGDVAERDDDGFYTIKDRIKDMYISGGENVYPAEVEEALMAHPDVVEAAVVGVEHERWGETGKAFVVARTGSTTGPSELIEWSRNRLATFKVPNEVVFVDALPRSGANKVLKRELASKEDLR